MTFIPEGRVTKCEPREWKGQGEGWIEVGSGK